MATRKNSLLCALTVMLLLSACASPPPSAPLQLPPQPKPQAPADLMQPLPEPSHFLRSLREIFSTSPDAPTK